MPTYEVEFTSSIIFTINAKDEDEAGERGWEMLKSSKITHHDFELDDVSEID